MQLSVRILHAIDDVPSAAWDALVPPSDPFLLHGFLSALERSGSVGEETAWHPRHIVGFAGEQLVFAVPLYLKHDSFGEFIFDFGFARAAHGAGIQYYPKLTSAVPFTPAPGPRILRSIPLDALLPSLLETLRDLAERERASSIHFLFMQEDERQALAECGFAPRTSYQFQWHRNPEWRSFDDYLASVRAPVRKQIRKERERANSHGLSLVFKHGAELTEQDRDMLFRFYVSTASDKGGQAYLNHAFYKELWERMRANVAAALAYDAQGNAKAGAFFLQRGEHLYGRYWGTDALYDAMHFELCYYLPLEWALHNGITRFEAGAQGEHKLKRGFLPHACYSSHLLMHTGLHTAVANYLAQERDAVASDMQELLQHSPFRAE